MGFAQHWSPVARTMLEWENGIDIPFGIFNIDFLKHMFIILNCVCLIRDVYLSIVMIMNISVQNNSIHNR